MSLCICSCYRAWHPRWKGCGSAMCGPLRPKCLRLIALGSHSSVIGSRGLRRGCKSMLRILCTRDDMAPRSHHASQCRRGTVFEFSPGRSELRWACIQCTRKSTLLNATHCQDVVPTSGWRACAAVTAELNTEGGKDQLKGESIQSQNMHVKSLSRAPLQVPLMVEGQLNPNHQLFFSSAIYRANGLAPSYGD